MPFTLNPFIYGKPVPVDRHIGRHSELRTLFGRLVNRESTAVVGEPRIGKTSLLRVFGAPEVQKDWLGNRAEQLITVEIDFYEEWLDETRTTEDFWQRVLEGIEPKLMDKGLQEQVRLVSEDEYSSSRLKELFRQLGQQGWHVVLIIDEFDALLKHKNFSTVEFLGSLRSIATTTDGLQLIPAGIMSLEEMNQRTAELSPGSPMFNYLDHVRPGPFSPESMNQLLDQTLSVTEVKFSSEDLSFIEWVSGRHPYRVQLAGASVFDAIVKGLEGAERYAYAGKRFYKRASPHFDVLWRRFLDDNARTVMVILGLVELSGVAQRRRFSFGEIEQPQRFSPELERLEELGLVEKTGQGWQLDKENLLLWQGERWRVAAGGFVWWLADVVIAGTRNIPDFEEWLHNREVVGHVLTRKQWETVKSLPEKVPESFRVSIGSIIQGYAVSFLQK